MTQRIAVVNVSVKRRDWLWMRDSSRYWPADHYTVGQSPPSFDKQFVRDYLETLDWDKSPPAPRLPKEVIEKSSAKYVEAFRRLTGSELADA
jgi:phosphoribosylaminoimidazole-succinocarboxamide synthase